MAPAADMHCYCMRAARALLLSRITASFELDSIHSKARRGKWGGGGRLHVSRSSLTAIN